MIKSLSLLLLVLGNFMFSQMVYEGNGFNHKQLFIFNDDNSFETRSLSRGCMDDGVSFHQSFGRYEINNSEIKLFIEKKIESTLPHSDSLIVKSDSLNILKKIIKSENVSEIRTYDILKYKNYQFLMPGFISDSILLPEYIKISDMVDQDGVEIEHYIIGSPHQKGNFNYDKEQIINSIPKKYRNYFHKKPIELKVLSYKMKNYRDPNIVPWLSDNEAMLYEYVINLNKGMKDGIFKGMKVYPKKDLKNCYGFEIIESSNRRSVAKQTLTDKCTIEKNEFSTKRTIVN